MAFGRNPFEDYVRQRLAEVLPGPATTTIPLPDQAMLENVALPTPLGAPNPPLPAVADRPVYNVQPTPAPTPAASSQPTPPPQTPTLVLPPQETAPMSSPRQRAIVDQRSQQVLAQQAALQKQREQQAAQAAEDKRRAAVLAAHPDVGTSVGLVTQGLVAQGVPAEDAAKLAADAVFSRYDAGMPISAASFSDSMIASLASDYALEHGATSGVPGTGVLTDAAHAVADYVTGGAAPTAQTGLGALGVLAKQDAEMVAGAVKPAIQAIRKAVAPVAENVQQAGQLPVNNDLQTGAAGEAPQSLGGANLAQQFQNDPASLALAPSSSGTLSQSPTLGDVAGQIGGTVLTGASSVAAAAPPAIAAAVAKPINAAEPVTHLGGDDIKHGVVETVSALGKAINKPLETVQWAFGEMMNGIASGLISPLVPVVTVNKGQPQVVHPTTMTPEQRQTIQNLYENGYMSPDGVYTPPGGKAVWEGTIAAMPDDWPLVWRALFHIGTDTALDPLTYLGFVARAGEAVGAAARAANAAGDANRAAALNVAAQALSLPDLIFNKSVERGFDKLREVGVKLGGGFTTGTKVRNLEEEAGGARRAAQRARAEAEAAGENPPGQPLPGQAPPTGPSSVPGQAPLAPAPAPTGQGVDLGGGAVVEPVFGQGPVVMTPEQRAAQRAAADQGVGGSATRLQQDELIAGRGAGPVTTLTPEQTGRVLNPIPEEGTATATITREAAPPEAPTLTVEQQSPGAVATIERAPQPEVVSPEPSANVNGPATGSRDAAVYGEPVGQPNVAPIYDEQTGEMLSGDGIERYQWVRNAQHGQVFGTQYEVRPLTPELRTTYNITDPAATHVALTREGGQGPWMVFRVGSLGDVRPSSDPRLARWWRPVQSFDDPEAIAWGRNYDAYDEVGNPPPPAGMPEPLPSDAEPTVAQAPVSQPEPAAAAPPAPQPQPRVRPEDIVPPQWERRGAFNVDVNREARRGVMTDLAARGELVMPERDLDYLDPSYIRRDGTENMAYVAATDMGRTQPDKAKAFFAQYEPLAQEYMRQVRAFKAAAGNAGRRAEQSVARTLMTTEFRAKQAALFRDTFDIPWVDDLADTRRVAAQPDWAALGEGNQKTAMQTLVADAVQAHTRPNGKIESAGQVRARLEPMLEAVIDAAAFGTDDTLDAAGKRVPGTATRARSWLREAESYPIVREMLGNKSPSFVADELKAARIAAYGEDAGSRTEAQLRRDAGISRPRKPRTQSAQVVNASVPADVTVRKVPNRQEWTVGSNLPAESQGTLRKVSGGFTLDLPGQGAVAVPETTLAKARAWAQAKVAESTVAPTKTVARSVEDAAPASLPPLGDNFRKRLDAYAPVIYHEDDPADVERFLPNSGTGGTVLDGDIFFANTPDLALGQGKSKGVLMAFDADKIQGRVSTRKPGWEFAYQHGQAELVDRLPDEGNYRAALRSVTVRPDTQMDRVTRARLDRSFQGLQDRLGWTKTVNADGSITYRRPDVTDRPTRIVDSGLGFISPSMRRQMAVTEAIGRKKNALVDRLQPTPLEASPDPGLVPERTHADALYNSGRLNDDERDFLNQEIKRPEVGVNKKTGKPFDKGLRQRVDSPVEAAQKEFNQQTLGGRDLGTTTVLDAIDELVAQGLAEDQIDRIIGRLVAEAQGIPVGDLLRQPTTAYGKAFRELKRGWGTWRQFIRDNTQFGIHRIAAGYAQDAISDAWTAQAFDDFGTAIKQFNPGLFRSTLHSVRQEGLDALKETAQMKYLDEVGETVPHDLIVFAEGRSETSLTGPTTAGRISFQYGNKTIRPLAPLASEYVRDFRTTGDRMRRLLAFDHVFRGDLRDAAPRFDAALLERANAKGADPELWKAAIKDRMVSGDKQFLFSPEDVRAATGDEALARAWRSEIKQAKKHATAAVNKMYFTYKQTRFDQLAGQTFFFHYWMTRATVMHTEMALRNPRLMATYYRFWQGMQAEAEREGYPDTLKSYIRFHADTAAGWFAYFDPLSLIIPFTMFREVDNKYAPLYERVGLYINPMIEAAAAVVGMTDNVPNLLGTGGFESRVLAVWNYWQANGLFGHQIGDGKPDATITQRVWQSVYETINKGLVGRVPGVKAFQPFDPNSYIKDQLVTLIQTRAEQLYGPRAGWTPDVQDQVKAAIAALQTDPRKNDLAHWAQQQWATQSVKGSALSGIVPARVRSSARDNNALLASAGYDAKRAGQEPTPEQQAAMDAQAVARSGDPALTMDNQAYHAIGTPEQQANNSLWGKIANSGREDEIPVRETLDGTEVIDWGVPAHTIPPELAKDFPPTTINDLVAMDDGARKDFADKMIVARGGPEALDNLHAYQDERKAFRDAHPAYADYNDYTSIAYDYPGGPLAFGQALRSAAPQFDAYLKEQEAKGPLTEGDITGIPAYLAWKGEKWDVYAPPPVDASDPTAIPVDISRLGAGGGSTDTGSGSTKDKQTPEEKAADAINTDLAQLDLYTKAADQVAGGGGSKLTYNELEPYSKAAVEAKLEAMGIKKPSVSGTTKLYLMWRELQPPGADNSVAAFIAWRNEQNGQNADAMGLSPDDAKLLGIGS